MSRIFKTQTRALRQLLRIAGFCQRTTAFWKPSYPKVFARAVRLCRKEGFTPSEAFRLGLFNSVVPAGGTPELASKKRWTELQLSVNPESWLFLTRDKGIFYRYCMALGAPIPELYAIFFRAGAGWSPDGAALKSAADWEAFFESEVRSEFLIKPANGSYSRAVSLYRRTAEGFVDAIGQRHRAGDIYDAMRSHRKYDSFVIQERLLNHPDLSALSGTESLQTVRVITLIERSGGCRILHAHFKPIIGPHLVDTFMDGLAGNVEATVRPDDGQLTPASHVTGSGSGTETIKVHPKTGVRFDGFRLPLWGEVCALVTGTAPKFLPIRTIGWDVALTPKGPVIVEGNSLWDPPNQHGCIEYLSSQLSRESGLKC